MRNVAPWRPLFACDDERRARTVATCLEAMEFETRLGHQGSGGPTRRYYVVEVPEVDLPALRELVDEILAEQDEFDAFLADWYEPAARARQRLVLTIVVLVSGLAVVGAIKL